MAPGATKIIDTAFLKKPSTGASEKDFDEAIDVAKSGDLSKIVALIKTDGIRLMRHQHSKYGVTAMMAAASLNRVDIVTLLLDIGANLHALDISGHNVLFWACKFGHVETVDALMKRGATFDAALTADDLKSFKKEVINAVLSHSKPSGSEK